MFKKKKFLLFSYKSFPLVTVNNYKNKNKKFVNFNIKFCLHCKNIFFKQFNYCKILYKNYSNKRYEYQKKLFIQNLIDEKIIVFNNRPKTKLLCIGKNIFSIKKNIKHRILINYATPFVGKKNINYYLKNKKN